MQKTKSKNKKGNNTQKNLISKLIEKEGFVLYVVTDDKFLPKGKDKRSLERIREIVRRCAEGGAKIFQYRAKKLPADVQFIHSEVAKDECEKNNLYFFVNDRVDIALLVGADGVHLGQNDIPPDKVKRAFGSKLKIGFSTHTEKEVELATKIYASDGIVDYISFGPVFGTSTKEDALSPRGISKLKEAVRMSAVPVVAIGGINENNIEDVLKAGCRVVAVISAVLQQEGKIEKNCRKLIEKARKSLL